MSKRIVVVNAGPRMGWNTEIVLSERILFTTVSNLQFVIITLTFYPVN